MKILKLGLVGLAVLVVISFLSTKEPSGRAADPSPIPPKHAQPVPAFAPTQFTTTPYAPPVLDDVWEEDDAIPVAVRQGWYTSWYEAKEECDRVGCPAFVDVRTKECVHCDQLESTTLKDLRVIEGLKKFACVHIDASQDPDGIARKLGVTSFPTTLVVKPDGTIVSRREGFADALTLRADLDKAFKKMPTATVCPFGICPAGTVCGPLGCSANGCNCTAYGSGTGSCGCSAGSCASCGSAGSTCGSAGSACGSCGSSRRSARASRSGRCCGR